MAEIKVAHSSRMPKEQVKKWVDDLEAGKGNRIIWEGQEWLISRIEESLNTIGGKSYLFTLSRQR